jgi:3-phosphoglycerate kinase
LKQTIRDYDITGKRVLVRVDYNVPMNEGTVVDSFRIESSFETLRYLLGKKCSLVLISHLGEPKGAPEAKYSLRPVAEKAAELLGQEIHFYDDCIGDEVVNAAKRLEAGQIMMVENVRFHQEELDNSSKFATELAKLGEVYVNDAFAVDHRKQASVTGVPKHLPAIEGLLVEKEVRQIVGALDSPVKPLVGVLGGAKVSTKIPILENLIKKVDIMMLTGPIANTFALAHGYNVGKSVVEVDMIDTAHSLLELAKKHGTKLLMPTEVLVSKSISEPINVREVALTDLEDDDIIVDATPGYAKRLSQEIKVASGGTGKATVIWNGPLGVTEVPEFSQGTRAMAEAIAAVDGTTIIGGGDTASYVDEVGMHNKFTWVSTGGGASLEIMSGNKLPGVEALLDK